MIDLHFFKLQDELTDFVTLQAKPLTAETLIFESFVQFTFEDASMSCEFCGDEIDVKRYAILQRIETFLRMD